MKGKLLISSVFTTLLISILILSIVLSINQTLFFVYAIGTPDEHGNVIMEIHIYQHNGTAYDLLLNHTTSTNFTCKVESDTYTRFECKVRFNKTFAVDEEESFDYTRVYLNVTDIYTNELMLNISGNSDDDYWYVLYRKDWEIADKPEYGVDYDVSFNYDAYY